MLPKKLLAIFIAIVCSASWVAQSAEPPKEKYMGKWDRNSGTVSFTVKELNGKKQARMIVAEERLEDRRSKLSISMGAVELDELDEFMRIAAEKMENPDTEYDRSLTLASKEDTLSIGTLIYPNSTLKIFITKPADQVPHVSMIIQASGLPANQTRPFVYWMDREDLTVFRKLLNKVLLAVG
jgi:hypothetical protein